MVEPIGDVAGRLGVASRPPLIRLLRRLMDVEGFGDRVVPMVPDETRTFGMDRCRGRSRRRGERSDEGRPRSHHAVGASRVRLPRHGRIGLSDTGEALRRRFGVDAEHIAVAALAAPHRSGKMPRQAVNDAIKAYRIPGKFDL